MQEISRSQILLLLGVLLLVAGAGVGWSLRASADGDSRHSVTSDFRVEGMTCTGCEVGIELSVGKLDGVVDVEASYEEGMATVTYDPEEVDADEIVGAIETLGYSAEPVEGSQTDTRED